MSSKERAGTWVGETDWKRQTAARIRVTSKRPFGSVIISETSKLILSRGGRNTTLTITGRRPLALARRVRMMIYIGIARHECI